MRQATFVSEQEESHWFELNHAGEIIQTVNRIGAQVRVINWKLHEHILDYKLITDQGVQHAVVLTKSGLYYVKLQECKSEQQAVRIESREGVNSLFISLQGEAIYIGYMVHDLKQSSFVLRAYRQGVWHVSNHLIPSERVDAPFTLKQAVYAMNVKGILYGLLRMEEVQTGMSRLCSFRLNTMDEDIVWQPVYETKSLTTGWQICIDHDSAEGCHASWVFQQEQSVHFFYNRLYALQHHRFRYISLELEVPRPYFMNQMGILSLLFVYKGEKIGYTCSKDEGENWSSFQEMQFQTGFPLTIVQGIRREQERVTTHSEIGFSAPLFRPLTWLDIVNPFYAFQTLLPANQIASHTTYFLKQMEQYIMQELMQLQRDMSQLVQRKQELEGRVKEATEEIHRLTAVEQLMLQELENEGNPFAGEPFSSRRIQ